VSAKIAIPFIAIAANANGPYFTGVRTTLKPPLVGDAV
jgi:hypothetical protein